MKTPILSLLFFTLFIVSCKQEIIEKPTRLEGNVFGTVYHITYLDATKNYQKSIDSLFYLVNKSLSTYMPTSDISKINKGDTTVVVDAMFLEVFKKSKRIYKETDGYFDITVGNLVNAWGFGPKKQKIDLDSSQVKEQMKFVGLDKVSIEKGKVKKQFSEIYLDVNSIAKGYGIDVVGRFFESKNITNYLIEIGGEIRARGKNSKQKSWKVGVDNPNTDGSRSIATYVTLSNQAMAGSGNYRKYRIAKNGKKYVHTVNPKTGFATESNLLSATVYGNLDCADVDAYATSFMAMGLEKAKLFLAAHPNVKAILVYLNADGEIESYKQQ